LQVIGAKVVTNARTPGARCYGYVTMATSEDATKCIQHLHRTELHGRMISVERVCATFILWAHGKREKQICRDAVRITDFNWKIFEDVFTETSPICIKLGEGTLLDNTHD
jgi:hypothetical protein